MTKRTSLTRKVRQRRKAITPTAMAKLQALEKLYAQTLSPATSRYTWSDTQPNTIIENSCSACEEVCVRESSIYTLFAQASNTIVREIFGIKNFRMRSGVQKLNT